LHPANVLIVDLSIQAVDANMLIELNHPYCLLSNV